MQPSRASVRALRPPAAPAIPWSKLQAAAACQDAGASSRQRTCASDTPITLGHRLAPPVPIQFPASRDLSMGTLHPRHALLRSLAVEKLSGSGAQGRAFLKLLYVARFLAPRRLLRHIRPITRSRNELGPKAPYSPRSCPRGSPHPDPRTFAFATGRRPVGRPRAAGLPQPCQTEAPPPSPIPGEHRFPARAVTASMRQAKREGIEMKKFPATAPPARGAKPVRKRKRSTCRVLWGEATQVCLARLQL